LIIKQQGQHQLTTGKPAAFYDIVESPKGLIRIVQDVFGAFYLWISKNGEQGHPKRIIAISTIRFVESKKVSSKNQSHSAGKVCFTANCQEFPSAAGQQEVAFQVKIPLANYDDFVKIIKDGIKQTDGFHSCAIKQGMGMMKSFSLTEESCFRDLIVQKKSGQVAGTEQTKKFYDVVESPKGQITVVRDYFGADYLWISKNNQQEMACIIPLSTIRGVTACKITGKKPTPHDHLTARAAAAAGHRQPLESPSKQLHCRVQVEVTANCQTLVDGLENEIQHGTVFWVKLPTASYNKFLKIIGGVSNKH
jgi:hypothetical protein